jgi:hypothetical protein
MELLCGTWAGDELELAAAHSRRRGKGGEDLTAAHRSCRGERGKGLDVGHNSRQGKHEKDLIDRCDCCALGGVTGCSSC